MRARRWLLACAFALSVPALALAITLVAASAQESPPPTPGGATSPVPAGSSPAPGATPSTSSNVTGSNKALPGDPSNGQSLFGPNCASCHGADLTGGVGPRLNPIAHLGNTKNPLDPTYLINVITNGLKDVPCSQFNCSQTNMPPKGGNSQLSTQDIKDLASFIIQDNRTGGGQPALDPRQLAIENVKWVTIGIAVMLILTWMLARYNMRWIDRRAAARRERIERQGRG
jgi:mono/diheme cytochrome c family protein